MGIESTLSSDVTGHVGIVDGGDVEEGASTDAKVTGDSAGTVSAKLRGLLAANNMRVGIVKYVTFSTSASGDSTIVSPTGSNKIKVLAISDNSSGSAASNWFYRSGLGSTQISKTSFGILGVRTGDNRDGGMRELFETAPGAALVFNQTGAVAFSCDIAYLDEP